MQMMLEDKLNVIQDAPADSFKMAKALQQCTMTEKVFGLVETMCVLGDTAMQLVGVPLPVVALIKSIRSLVLGSVEFTIDRMIRLCSTDHVQKLLKIKESAHAYNQKVKAYNAQPGLPKECCQHGLCLQRQLHVQGGHSSGAAICRTEGAFCAGRQNSMDEYRRLGLCAAYLEETGV